MGLRCFAMHQVSFLQSQGFLSDERSLWRVLFFPFLLLVGNYLLLPSARIFPHASLERCSMNRLFSQYSMRDRALLLLVWHPGKNPHDHREKCRGKKDPKKGHSDHSSEDSGT